METWTKPAQPLLVNFEPHPFEVKKPPKLGVDVQALGGV